MKALIWLDTKEAWVGICGNDSFERVRSNIDTGRPKGGSRSAQPWGPMDKTSEPTFLNKRLQQEKDYFQRVRDQVAGADEVLVQGPGQMKLKFRKFLHDQHDSPECSVTSSENITENQFRARMRDCT